MHILAGARIIKRPETRAGMRHYGTPGFLLRDLQEQ
jgi:hypothetical protein